MPITEGYKECSSHIGWDADLVIWDSHPLSLGATPKQVIIDGIPQLPTPYIVEKPDAFQVAPKVPNFDKEAKETVGQLPSFYRIDPLSVTLG